MTLERKLSALRWAQLNIVKGGQRRYWKAQEAILRAEIQAFAAEHGIEIGSEAV